MDGGESVVLRDRSNLASGKVSDSLDVTSLSCSSSCASSVKGEDPEAGQSENVTLRLRRQIPKVFKLRTLKKGDLSVAHDHTVTETHKAPLFAVDVAPYVMPPISRDEVEKGTEQYRRAANDNFEFEVERVRKFRNRLKKHGLKLSHYDETYDQWLRDGTLRLIDKGRKQRELLGTNVQYLVATSGSKFVCVYVTTQSPASKLILRQTYEDEDGDEFYTVKFTTFRSYRRDGSRKDHRVLVCAGLRGVIRVLDVQNGDNINSIAPAAGNSINDMAVHPEYPEVVAFASKDLAVRVWNVFTSIQVFTLCSRGLFGHVDEILTCDWSPDRGRKLISSGMDHYLTLWDLSDEKYETALEWSFHYTVEASAKRSTKNFHPDNLYKPKLPLRVYFPQLVNKTIHKNYIDCAKFLTKDIVISKSSENYLAAWTARASNFVQDDNTVKSVCDLIFQYELTSCRIWFMKFALQPTLNRLLALGLQDGRIMVMDLKSDPDPTRLRVSFYRPSGNSSVGAIRQVAFSPDSKVIIAVTQDAKTVKYSLSGEAVESSRITFDKFPTVDCDKEIMEDIFTARIDPKSVKNNLKLVSSQSDKNDQKGEASDKLEEKMEVDETSK